MDSSMEEKTKVSQSMQKLTEQMTGEPYTDQMNPSKGKKDGDTIGFYGESGGYPPLPNPKK